MRITRNINNAIKRTNPTIPVSIQILENNPSVGVSAKKVPGANRSHQFPAEPTPPPNGLSAMYLVKISSLAFLTMSEASFGSNAVRRR